MRRRAALGLTPEQARVLERYDTASCGPAPRWRSRRQDRLAAIDERLASLGTQFGQNVLADEKSYALVLEEDDLAGLPDFARAAAARGGAGARPRRQIRHHAGALERRAVPAVLGPPRPAREGVPRLDHARRKRRGDRQPGDHRRDGARCAPSGRKLLGFETLPTTGSTTRWRRPRRRRASCSTRSGAGARQGAAPSATPAGDDRAGGRQFCARAWDWRYYAEKLRKARFDLDEAEIEPYFRSTT